MLLFKEVKFILQNVTQWTDHQTIIFILLLVKTPHTCYILNVKIGLWDGNSKFAAYQKIQVYEKVTGENICLLSLILQKNQVIQIEVCCFLSSKAQFYKHKPHSVW